jgi:hypothetical protein
MSDALLDLEKACTDAATDAATLRLAGESWFAGQPARAERGQVALSVGSGETIVVRSEDIAAVEKLDSLFMIRVRPGASVLIRLERTATVGDSCGCEPQPPGQTVAAKKKFTGRMGHVNWPHGNLGGVFDWPNTCFIYIQTKLVCDYIYVKGWDGEEGKVLRLCWPEWTVVETCPDPIQV